MLRNTVPLVYLAGVRNLSRHSSDKECRCVQLGLLRTGNNSGQNVCEIHTFRVCEFDPFRPEFSIQQLNLKGNEVAQLVEALRYKPESRGFDSRWGHEFFCDNSSGRAVALGSTQPLTETSTRNHF